MLKMGLPVDAVKHAMKRDEKNPTIMDLDPEKSLKSQQKEVRAGDEKSDDGPALKDDPEYQKVGQERVFALNPLRFTLKVLTR
jgi:hypothetical protein